MSKKASTHGYRSAISGRYVTTKDTCRMHGAPMTTARIERVRNALVTASEKAGEFRPSANTHSAPKRDPGN